MTWSKSSSQAHPSGQKAEEVSMWRRTVRIRRSMVLLVQSLVAIFILCISRIRFISQVSWSLFWSGSHLWAAQGSSSRHRGLRPTEPEQGRSRPNRAESGTEPDRARLSRSGWDCCYAENHQCPCQYSISILLVNLHCFVRVKYHLQGDSSRFFLQPTAC